MEISVLKERALKAGEKVEKCKGTIVRHEKQLDKKVQALIKQGIDLTGLSNEEIENIRDGYRSTDTSWNIYEVIMKREDIKGANRKLRDAEEVLSNWNEKLSIEINREKFIEDNAPQVIKDFLENWKQKAYEWHIKRYNDYQVLKKRLEKERYHAIVEFVKANPEEFDRYLENGEVKEYWMKDLINVRGKGLESHLKELNRDYGSIQEIKFLFAGGNIQRMDGFYRENERLEWLEKTLEREKKMKMLDLINRISKVIGEITDASHLKINEKNNIDGFVVGNKGKAQVDTIEAGGWNIVCFHYRTLVKPMK